MMKKICALFLINFLSISTFSQRAGVGDVYGDQAPGTSPFVNFILIAGLICLFLFSSTFRELFIKYILLL